MTEDEPVEAVDEAGERYRINLLRAFSVAKRDDGENEDRWVVASDGSAFAICDGASVSFDPGPWAAILARRFVEDTEITPDWICSAALEYNQSRDRDTMPWMLQAAFDRGSFATLLGIEVLNQGQALRIMAIGDSMLAFVDGSQVVRTIPYLVPEEFDASPQLISTNPAENRAWDGETIDSCWHQLNIASHEKPTLLMMTDALGRWLLEQPNSDRVEILFGIQDQEAFRQFVEKEREEGRMRRDDTTLLVIG
jgi:hypothetical protein